jgi:hypothetical protein
MATGDAKSPFDCREFFVVFPLFFATVEIYQYLAPTIDSYKTEREGHWHQCYEGFFCVGMGARGPWVAAEAVTENVPDEIPHICAMVKMEAQLPPHFRGKVTSVERRYGGSRPGWSS